jgi:hypothetical protein
MLNVSKLVKRAPSAARAMRASAVDTNVSVPSPALTAPTPDKTVPAVIVSAAEEPVTTTVGVAAFNVATKPPEFVLAFNVVMPESKAPKVSLAVPETFTVVGPAAKVTALAEVFEATFNVSMPVAVNVPPVVWLDKVKLAESAVPATTEVL